MIVSMDRPLLIFAALNGALAVALGAFAAHGVGSEAKALLATGGHYQMVHAALGAVCALAPAAGRRVRAAGWLAVSGGLVFSLALAGIALLGQRLLGAVAPVGGTLMILGWLVLALAAAPHRPRTDA